MSLIVPNAMHPNWYGGGSFSGRFSWSAAIVFILPVIYGLLKLANAGSKIFQIITGLALSLQAYFFYQYTFENVNLYNKAAVTWFDSYSIYYFPIHSWMPMLYNSAWAYDYPPNYAWLIFTVSLVFAGFSTAQKLKTSISYALVLGFLIIFASGFITTNSKSHKTIFYGKDLPSQTGRIQHLARVAEQGIDNLGFVNFGPYFPLRKGRYTLLLKYSSSAPVEQALGKFDIFDSTSKNQISEYSLHGTAGDLKVLQVSFEVASWTPHLYEFRNYWHGLYDLKIHEIVLQSF